MEGYFRRAMPEEGSIASRWLSPKMLLPVLALLLLVPYIKPLLAPLPVTLQDRWSEGVCLQSTPSTCGPASAGTILRYFGISASESELARECFSYGAGTENWYITRALRKRGLKAHYVIRAAQPAEIPYPCIAGTRLGGSGGPGHFVAILEREKARYIIGDPLVGRLSLTPEELHAQYFLTGFFLVITR
jgi:ABC-type bacteriocin/lantibiotic exporter with double-glycine peptidase domain